ncbi:hypothetical protein ASF84_05135 [Pseudomonas sp. Leaf127]|uniref:hypothetical protein n=1 Tax=Pseudomonas sp. Leaf127 TaxID=1736267 RepID=UPI000702D8B9|nr:hypothetical protein [Pseudomonas sp. Leaf127]KQQ60097.1 hypothetical protein ASF84_05135 [Pseudomonas sp. Leaf127]
MRRYIAVIHGWHVSSKGFNVHELKADTLENAEKEACWLKEQRDRPFDRCAYVVIEIEPEERLARRLTWRERLTGRA